MRPLSAILAVAALAAVLTGCGRKGGLDAPPGAFVQPAAVQPAEAAVQPAAVTAFDELREPPPRATGSVPEIGPDGRVQAPQQAPKQGPKEWTPLDWLID